MTVSTEWTLTNEQMAAASAVCEQTMPAGKIEPRNGDMADLLPYSKLTSSVQGSKAFCFP